MICSMQIPAVMFIKYEKNRAKLRSKGLSLEKILNLNKSRVKSLIPKPSEAPIPHFNLLLCLEPTKKFRVVMSTVNLVFCFGPKLRFWT